MLFGIYINCKWAKGIFDLFYWKNSSYSNKNKADGLTLVKRTANNPVSEISDKKEIENGSLILDQLRGRDE